MKKKLKNILISIIKPVNQRLGLNNNKLESAEFSKDNLLNTFYLNLIKIGFKVNHIIDVGANTGTWTHKTMSYFPDAYYTLVEPQVRLKEQLLNVINGNKKIILHHLGAGDKEGIFNFTIHDRDDSCTFKYTPEEAQKFGFEQIEVPIRTLNNLLKENNWPIPDLIKIDSEGLDLNVLMGASDYFGKTEIFMVEVAVFNKSFENNFLNMLNYMDSVGYTLFDITDLNRPFETNILWLAELVFVKKDGVINNFKIS